MSMVEPALQDAKPERRKAAYIAMAVVVEGCADYITNKYVEICIYVALSETFGPNSANVISCNCWFKMH